jgi:hypothetical protein
MLANAARLCKAKFGTLYLCVKGTLSDRAGPSAEIRRV